MDGGRRRPHFAYSAASAHRIHARLFGNAGPRLFMGADADAQ